MATISVGIIGLGRLGSSVGLALKRYNARKGADHQFQITGYDIVSDGATTAKTRGVIDTAARGLLDAAVDKDIVVLALPYSEVQPAYPIFGKALRPGAVVLDFSPLKLPSFEWAAKHLHAEAHLVGMTAVVNYAFLFDGLDDADHASAELFDRGSMLLMPAVKTVPDAVELASDFATLLGATPHFADPAEHDAWIGAVEGLPALLGVAAFYMLQQRRSWDDVQRAGNPSFGRLTHHLFDTHPDDLRDLLMNNRQHLLQHVDGMIEVLGALRAALAQNDRAAVEEVLASTSKTYEAWVNKRRTGDWGDKPRDERTSAGDAIMSGLFGTSLSKRLRRGRGDE